MPCKLLSHLLKVVIFTFLIFGLNLIEPGLALGYAPALVAPANPAGHTFLSQSRGAAPEQVFILLADNNGSQLAGVKQFIASAAGRVSHIFPDQALIAKIPPGAKQQLSTLDGVALVLTGPVDLSITDRYGPAARRYAGVWNSLLTPQPKTAASMTAAHSADHDDAFIAPDLPSAAGRNLGANGSSTPGYYQTSEYMAGSVAVGIVLVESNGSVDPSTEDWTAAEKQFVFNKIVAGLNWWVELEPRANLSFVYADHFSQPLPTGVEPITRPYYHQQYWINDAMGALGYDASSYFTRVRDYNNDLRAVYHTNWAFTIFVVDSSVDGDNRFSDGYFAYAYLGGPFMVMTYGNNGYGPDNMDAIAAHELGHIFYALDQYASAYQTCTHRSGYLDIENQNSQYGACTSNVNSIMRGQIYPYTMKAIDPYAAGQVGWRDSDGDNILDPLDVELPVALNSITITAGNNVTVSGVAEITPYPSPSHSPVTINTLAGVQYRFDGGDWQPALAADGAFDSTTEGYGFTAGSLSPGWRQLEVAAVDSVGNVSKIYATETIAILDPIDGGLNTELKGPALMLAGQTAIINGVAYHMEGISLAGVAYRINGGAWQSAIAQDGAFDSDYEPFTLTLEAPEPGTYLFEAFATDVNGYAEVNIASQQITVNSITVFLPLVTRGE